jgi:Zn-dependent protease
MPFQCPYCDQYFCVQHRLPENHSCSEYWRATIPRDQHPSRLHPSKAQPSYQSNVPLFPSPQRRGALWFSTTELKHLLIGAVLTLAIGFAMPLYGESILYGYPEILTALAALFTFSFIIHEIAHKLAAQRYGLWAEFRITMFGALITLVSIISPFKIISPGAVMIGGVADRRTIGKTAIAGPLTNIALAVLFFLLLQTLHGFTALVMHRSLMINAFIALFNLIPFGILDGSKIFFWSKPIWAAAFTTALLLSLHSYNTFQFLY